MPDEQTAPAAEQLVDILSDAELDQCIGELCKRSLPEFVREFWYLTSPEILIWEPHLDILCAEFEAAVRRLFMKYDETGKPIGRTEKAYDLIINIPPGTSKTSIISVLGPAWAWTNDPTLRFISGSYSASVSVGIAVKARDVITSAKYRRLFPHIEIKEDENKNNNYKTNQLGQRYTTSIGGSATSEHAHAIIIDDPINPKMGDSEQLRELANTWMDATLATRKVDKAVSIMILVMQRIHANDPTAHLMKKQEKGKKIRHICLPATLSSKVKPAALKAIYRADGTLSARMPPAVLKDQEIDLGSYAYAAQFGQTPAPAGGGIWKAWFREVPDVVFPSSALLTSYGTDWDLAYTSKQKNSASAYVVAGRMGNNIYIDEIGWDWLQFPDLIRYMKLRPSPHFIEAKASGISARQTLQAQGIPAIEVKVPGGEDKEARARLATPIAEGGLVYIRASLAARLYADAKQGLLHFPKAEHDDLADTIAQTLARLDPRNAIKAGNAEAAAQDGSDYFDDDDLPY